MQWGGLCRPHDWGLHTHHDHDHQRHDSAAARICKALQSCRAGGCSSRNWAAEVFGRRRAFNPQAGVALLCCCASTAAKIVSRNVGLDQPLGRPSLGGLTGGSRAGRLQSGPGQRGRALAFAGGRGCAGGSLEAGCGMTWNGCLAFAPRGSRQCGWCWHHAASVPAVGWGIGCIGWCRRQLSANGDDVRSTCCDQRLCFWCE